MLTEEEWKEHDTNLTSLIRGMTDHFGRVPTEAEVIGFLYGSPEKRHEIYENKGLT